jgi:hypothetical protein
MIGFALARSSFSLQLCACEFFVSLSRTISKRPFAGGKKATEGRTTKRMEGRMSTTIEQKSSKSERNDNVSRQGGMRSGVKALWDSAALFTNLGDCFVYFHFFASAQRLRLYSFLRSHTSRPPLFLSTNNSSKRPFTVAAITRFTLKRPSTSSS